MIWLALVLLAAASLAPLALALRRNIVARGQREAAIGLYRAQIAELDRDLAEGRIAAAEHAAARLEIERRLLAADAPERAAKQTTPSDRWPLLAVLILVLLAAIALYLPGGAPDLPGQPLAARLAGAEREARAAETLIAALRERLGTMDPASPRAREGYLLLGNAEAGRGNFAAAAEAWRHALAAGFDPTIAAETAEALSRADGSVTPEAAALFRRALAAAPADAPWRGLAEQRLGEVEIPQHPSTNEQPAQK